MIYVGQVSCYEKCPEILEKTMGVAVGHSQIQRIADIYGAEVGKDISATRTLPPLDSGEALYVEVDGSMIFTRDEDWKEVKVGRIFKSSDCIDPNGKQSWIRHSQYLAYLSNSRFFTDKMDKLIDSYGPLKQRLVFICDGAPWIRDWIEDAFPEAISVLDYFHALEHLYEFTGNYFKDRKRAEKWADKQNKLLLDGQVKQVIRNIKKLVGPNKATENLIAYYEANSNRMDYKKYRQIGCGIIGSGAIESAHRIVVQKRMKQSGQRWSSNGAQNMLNLRVTYENGKWQNIITLVKTNFRKDNFKKVA